MMVVSAAVTTPADASGSDAYASLAAAHWASAHAWLPDSATLSGVPVAAGRLLDMTGAPLANATVVLSAEPSSTILMALKDGQAVPTREISRAVTDGTGKFSLKIPAGNDLGSSTSVDNVVNFDVNAVTAAGSAPSFVSAQAVIGATTANDVTPTSKMGKTAQFTPVNSADLTLQMRTLGNGASVTPSAARPAVDPPPVCKTVQVSDLGPEVVVVGATSNASASVSSSFIYGQGQSSTLGVAVSASGANTTFTVSGTHTTSSTGTETYATYHGAANVNYKTMFDARKYHYYCTQINGPTTGYYYVQSTGWDGGATSDGRGAIAAGKCVTQQANSRFTLNSTTATTFATGFAVTGIISMTASTGYSNNGTIVYSFGGVAGTLCGVNDYPAHVSPGPGLVVTH